MADGFNAALMTMPQNAVNFKYDGINRLGFEYYRANLIVIDDVVSMKTS